MNLTKPQLIIVAVLGLIVVVFGLIFAGVLPGLQKNEKNPKKVQANLEFWGVGDTAQSYEEIFSNFKTVYPDVIINYRGFENADDYETALLDSLAAGKGPDIFMIQNAILHNFAGFEGVATMNNGHRVSKFC